MPESLGFVDIHCHLLPGIDDGSRSWEESLAMAQIAVDDGIDTVIVTPHQLGNFGHNTGDTIREQTEQLQLVLQEHSVPLTVLPGADVRIDESMVFKVRSGEVVTLADHGKHLLLELPHELYFPLDGLLEELDACGVVGILSHPERNQGILQSPAVIDHLLDEGCLMQVTAGSLMGTFGPRSQELSEQMLAHHQVQFVATDAHGCRSRRPLMQRAFERVAELTCETTATDLCCRNPAAVAAGEEIRLPERMSKPSGLAGWLPWRKAS